MSVKAWPWIVALAILGVGSLAVCGFFVFFGDNPREYVEKNYDCDRDPTDHASALCISSDSYQKTVDDLRDKTDPLDTINSNDATYFQYDDDIFAVFRLDNGDVEIQVHDYATGYREFHDAVGGQWSSVPPGDDSSGGK